MGGPAQPMPQDMAPPAQQLPPEAAMLQQVEQASAAQGQELGQAYAEQMMQGIDAAQSTEELINAFRGNEMPLDARRDELADYVGQGDADQTPESVLAMVQPVIMMTEEGAMNSGIGNLMQQLTGDIDMMTEAGQPTDMGQGVGSLMMAGAPEAPAPQNFRQGGEVKYLSNGTPKEGNSAAPSDPFRQLRSSEITKLLSGDFNFGTEVQTQYESLLPLFKEIGLEDRAQQEQERKEMDEAQVLLSLARGGLRLAAGDRDTSGSLVSQIGSAFEPTAAEISAIAAQSQDRRDAFRAQDQQLRLGALQAGISQAGTQQTLDLKRSIATLDALLGPQTAVDEVTIKLPDGTTKTLDLRTQFAEYRDAIDNQNALVVEPEASSRYGSGVTGQALNRLTNPDNLVSLVRGIQGDRSPESLTALADLSRIQEFDAQTGRAMNSVPVHLQPFVRLINDEVALRNFQEKSAKEIEVFNREYEQLASDIANEQKDPSELYKYVDARIATIAELDMESATGLPSGILNFAEAGAQQLGDLFGAIGADKLVGDGFSDVDQARRILDSVFQSVDRWVASAPNENRLLAPQYENLKNQLPKNSMFETDAAALGAIENYRDLISTDLEQLRILIRDAQLQKPSDLGRFRYRLMQAYNLKSLLDALAVNYKFGPGGEDIPSVLNITDQNLDEYLRESPVLQGLPPSALTTPDADALAVPDLDSYFRNP